MWREASRSLGRVWKGGVLRGLQTVCRVAVAIRPLPRVEGKPPAPRSVVVFSTAGIGDTLSDTPAIRALRESFPACRITVVVHRRRRAVLEGNPCIDRLVPHAKGPVRFWRTLRAIRQGRPDTAVTLRANDPDVWPLAYLSGARVIASRPSMTRFPFLVNVPVAVPDWLDRPGVEQTLEIVRALGADTTDPRMDFVMPEAARRRVDGLLREGAIGGRALVAMQVHESPRLTFRDWPVEHFAALGRRILEGMPVRLAITGGRNDVAAAEAIGRELGAGATVLAGRLSLPETAALLVRSRMLITTDTGIMHLGFAVRVPTLALLHPYNARRVGPHGYGGLHRVALLDPSLWTGEDPPRVGLDRLTPEAVWPVLWAFWQEVGRGGVAERSSVRPVETEAR